MGWSKDNGTVAKRNADYAKVQGDYAKTEANKVGQFVEENKTRWLPAVATVALRNSTYPNPQHGDTVRVTGEAKTYRYVSPTGWVVTDIYDATAIDQVAQQLAQTTTDLDSKKADKTEVSSVSNALSNKAFRSEVFLKGTGININDFDEPTRQTFLTAQGIDVNYVLGSGAVKNKNLQFGVDPLKIDGIKEKIRSSNLLDLKRVEPGGYYNTSGSWVTSSSYSSSQFIPVTQGETYYKNGSSHVTYWDENRSFLIGESVGTSFTIPSNPNIRFMKVGLNLTNVTLENWVISVRSTLPKSNFDSRFVIDGSKFEFIDEYLSKVTRKELGTLDSFNVKDIKSLLQKLKIQRVNLIDPSDIVSGGYYHQNGYFLTSGNTSTGLIKVTAGENLRKSGSSVVTYYDENEQFILGLASVVDNFTVPNDSRIRYMRSSMPSDYSKWMVVRGTTLPSVFVPYNEFSIPTLQNIGGTAPISPNASKTLELSVAGHTQNTHPSMLWFENGWNGYKYWMAVTPYPDGNAFYENPCIIASNDMTTWVAPSPIVNPLDAVPESEKGQWFNSDTELVFVGGRMELWWRRRNNSPYSEEFYRRTSTNGVTWTEKELCFRSDSASAFLSPSIIHEGGKYKMWTINGEDGKIYYFEGVTGKDFSLIREFTIGNSDAWHGTVRRNSSGLYEVYYSHGVRHRNYKISYAYSTDNINWSDPVVVLKSVPLRFDSELYRPTFVDVKGKRNDIRIMAYGTVSENSEFNIAITRALTVDPTNFQGMN